MRTVRLRARPHPVHGLVLLVLFPSIVIAGIYMLPFVAHRDLLPFGSDTLGYVWRTGVARTLGLDALRSGVFRPPIQPLGNRPAYLVVAGIIETVTGVGRFTFAWISPALLAVIAGLAAGVTAVEGLEEPRRLAPVYAIGLGGSVFLTWTAAGYATNLMLDGAAIAIAAVVLLMIRRRASWPIGVALLAASFLIHWMFASVFAAILVAFAGAILIARRLPPSSRIRGDAAAARVPSPRPFVLLVLVGIPAGILIVLTLPPQIGFTLPDVSATAPSHAVSLKLIVRDTAAIAWFGVPLAGLALVGAFHTRRRWPAFLLGIWSSLALVGGLAWWILRLPVPPYRWAAFALGLPVLAISVGPRIGEGLVRRLGRVARHLGDAVAVLVCLTLVAGGAHFWWTQRSHTSAERLQQLDTISHYLEGLPLTTPVFILVSRGANLPVDGVFCGLSPERLPYVRLLPAPRGWERGAASLQVPAAGSVILAPSTFLRGPTPEGEQIGPGVLLVLGPSPAAPLPSPAIPRAPSAPLFAWDLVVALVALCAAGVGWMQFVRVSVPSRLALAPALGMTMMGLFGTALGRVGIHPNGLGAFVILALTAAVGLLAAGWSRRRQRLRP